MMKLRSMIAAKLACALAIAVATPAQAFLFGTIAGYQDKVGRGSVSLSGVVPELAAKAREIVNACGSRIISARVGRERSRVRGSGRPSLHRIGRAVDIAGNPTCIYAQLSGWPGGVSTDYARIRPQHVHVSYAPGGREWGARFAHWKPRAKLTRYAGASRHR